jgi:hypothetical protein
MTVYRKTRRRLKKGVNQGEVQKRLYSIEEAAVYLGRTVYAVREIYYSGKLPVVKIDGRIYIDIQDMDTLIEQSKVTVDYR